VVGFLIEPVIAPVIEPGLGFLPEGSRFGTAVAIALVIATALQMVVGELIPKNLAIARPVGVTLALAAPLQFMNLISKPLITLFNSAANATVRLMGIEPRDELSVVPSLEELEVMIQSSHEGGTLEAEEFSLLSRSISFGDRTARDVFTPRTSLTFVSAEDPVTVLMEVARTTGHSRFPVRGRDVDDLLGIAHVKDVYEIPAEDRGTTPIAAVMRDPIFVPEVRDLASLLSHMRHERQQMVIVVDEYGGTAGALTLEDILEEIVGEIEDEHDSRERPGYLTSPPSGVHVLSGALHGPELEELTGFEMPEGDYETLAGFLLSLFDRIPVQGEHVGYEGWEFKVVEMERNRIVKVLVAPGTVPRADL